MSRALRILGVAILITATVHATAGICLCHRGADAPIQVPGSHGCCLGGNTEGSTALSAVGACCHIESAERGMTTNDVVQLAHPVTVVIGVPEPAVRAASVRTLAPVDALSPPIQVLRL